MTNLYDDHRPVTGAEWDELAASLDHLRGPDAFDAERLEPALVPVTHYVPRLMSSVRDARAAPSGVRFDLAAVRFRLAEVDPAPTLWGTDVVAALVDELDRLGGVLRGLVDVVAAADAAARALGDIP